MQQEQQQQKTATESFMVLRLEYEKTGKDKYIRDLKGNLS